MIMRISKPLWLGAGNRRVGLLPGLFGVLQRGVEEGVVRNDLDRQVLTGAWPARIADALGPKLPPPAYTA